MITVGQTITDNTKQMRQRETILLSYSFLCRVSYSELFQTINLCQFDHNQLIPLPMITLSGALCDQLVTESNRVFTVTKQTLWLAGCKVKQTKLNHRPYTVEAA